MLFGTGPSTLRFSLFPAHGRRLGNAPIWVRRHPMALHLSFIDLQPTAAAHACYSGSAVHSATLSLTRARPTLMFMRKTAAPLSTVIASFSMYTIAASVCGLRQEVAYCIGDPIFDRQQTLPQTVEPYVISDSNASDMWWMPPRSPSSSRPSRPPRPQRLPHPPRLPRTPHQSRPHDESELDLQKIAMSGGLGFGVGYVVKKVSNIVLLISALGYGSIVLLRVKGFNINFEQYWPHVESTYIRALDLDGDGRVTEGDLHQVVDNVIDFFNRYLQRDASFMVGFLAGFYYA